MPRIREETADRVSESLGVEKVIFGEKASAQTSSGVDSFVFQLSYSETGYFQARMETTSCAIPTSNPRSPNRAARSKPRRATVSAFRSEVCLSIQEMALCVGGGFATISCRALILFAQ